MARHGGPVLVDTNVIIEASRVSAWKALTGGYCVETVEMCAIETQTGLQRRRKEQHIDYVELRASLHAVHAVSKAERAGALLKDEQMRFLDAGEQMLWAHALTRADAWVLCGPDKASLRVGIRLWISGSAHLSGALAQGCRLAPEDSARCLLATLARSDPQPAGGLGGTRAMTTPLEVRNDLVDLLRRDLIGPHPDHDADLAKEVLNDEKPSRWYVAGFIVPAYDGVAPPKKDEEEIAERREDDLLASETLDSPVTGEPDETDGADQPPRDRFLPSSIGLTVVLPETVKEAGLRVTWGDYKTVPPLPAALVIPDAPEPGDPKPEKPKTLHWVRWPGEARQTLDVTRNSGDLPLPGSAGRTGGALVVRVHQRTLTQTVPGGKKERLRVVTVFLVNKRKRARAPYTDLAYAFQARIELSCPAGFHPRADLSTYGSNDDDLRLADLHYRDVHDYGVGRNTSAGWDETPGAPVTRAWTDPLPRQEVERVAPSTDITDVEFGMQALADLAQDSASALVSALSELPKQYAVWRTAQELLLEGLAPGRREVAERLIANQDLARARIERGIALLGSDNMAREAFAIMNEAMATAARRRESIAQKKPPGDIRPPEWRPFQLAFVLLNLVGLTNKESPEREIVDLLFFPTGGGKTEAYLGLAAYAIALRQLRGSGVLGAGVSVIMRYTLRLLTLDQLSRAAGLVCALELMRARDAQGRKRLSEWPIEIGLWVGGAASPNRLRPVNSNDTKAATRWLSRYQSRPNSEKSPVPLKACPWCGTRFKPESFYFTPSKAAPQNLCIKCENAECDFTRDRALPIVVVDEPIYRRLPAFIIATVDKFASLPWIGQSGAFFGHVDRFSPDIGFYGAAEPGQGLPLVNGHRIDAPDLIIQDELHLISGPLGTVAGLYETAIDMLSSRQAGERLIRTKIVASTATVRRAQRQIQSLFDREETAVFPPGN